MLSPFLTALDQQLDFLNTSFPAAFNFFDVQRLAAMLSRRAAPARRRPGW